jgi:hypothetical protein
MKNNIFPKYLTLLFIFFLSFYAGWRLIGIDRYNYISMYEGVINSESFALKFYFAKDFFYLYLSEFNNFFTEETRYLFFVYIFFSFYIKFYVFNKLKMQYYILAFLIYTIFLSSVLEFIAFRSALSMSFLILAIFNKEQFHFYLFLLCAVLSHNSSILPVFIALPIFSDYLRKNKFIYFILLICPFFLSSSFLKLFPQGDNYISNQEGTLNAFLLPVFTLIISSLIFFKFDRLYIINNNNTTYKFIYNSKPIVFSLIYFSIGITPFVVTAATRYLEVVYLLLIITGITMFRKSYINLFGFSLLIILLTYLNIAKELWINMFNPI